MIILKKHILYNKKKYTEEEFFEIANEINNNIEIIIADDSIFISKYNLSDNNVEEFIDNIMKNIESNNKNLLTDYIFNKKEKILYLYSINAGKYINKLATGKRELKVVPIQFYIRKLLRFYLFNKKEVLILVKVLDTSYSIFYDKGYITYCSLIDNDKETLESEILKFNKNIEVIIDNNLLQFISSEINQEYKIHVKSIGRNISEKIYKI